ncbi:Bdr family repetitive protein [Borreliella americana]|uniref:Bdr family repetitive protein n=1 Tax=Borreliella americana TaxID=478807 RepID=UPI001E59788C|nr:Bdr family repetitive protein [Borreliella americana]MCD2332834.1 Bdr family repetitive protein [Borreliella americana]MCD2349741.1 Bdr family repetitive protein [Borreliella americana]
MNNLAYKTYNIESIKNEFLKIGFSEEAIDFVFLHNDNYNHEVLKEKIIDLEKNLQKDISSLDTKIDNVEKTLQKDISSLNTKIDSVEKTLQKDIFSLDNKINVLRNELTANNRTIQVILIMGITLAPIIYSIFNKYFLN